MMKIFYSCFFLLLTLRALSQPTVVLQEVASGLGFITDIAHAGDDRMFILNRHGVIRIVQNGDVLPGAYMSISGQVNTGGEMGALGLAFDPDFASNGRFYIHYNPSGTSMSRISRFTAPSAESTTADPATEQILLAIPQGGPFHNGGDIDFGPDGTLYFTLGDSFDSATAQDLTHPLGSIHRVDVSDGGNTYSIPADNPYANATGDTLKTIWAKGLRNPFRFGFDALTGDMWIGDVGSSAWEEVNFWPAGDHSGPNFGWRCFEGFVPASLASPSCGPAEDYVMPVAVQPTSGAWCSVIGGRVYRGNDHPLLYGRYIYTDYCAGLIYSLLPDGAGGWLHEQLSPGIGNFNICIGENSDLEMFLGKSSGVLYKITTPLTVNIDANADPAILVYPVPAQDRLVIEGALIEAGAFQLFDHAGRSVSAGTLIGSAGRAAIDVTALNNGSYVLVVKTTGREVLRRVVAVLR